MVMISFVLWLLCKNCLIFKILTNFEYFDKPGSVERPQVHSQQVIIYSYRHFTRPCLLPRVTEPDPLSNNTFYALSSHFYIFYKLTGDDLVLNMSFYDAATHKNYENLPSHWAAKHKMWGESKWFHDENLFKRKLWPGLEVVHTDVEAQAEA